MIVSLLLGVRQGLQSNLDPETKTENEIDITDRNVRNGDKDRRTGGTGKVVGDLEWAQQVKGRRGEAA